MIHPPHWLTNQAIDLISSDEYEALHTEFMDASAEEEKTFDPPFHLYPFLKQGLEKGTFWHSLALMSPTALLKIFYDYIQPRFSKTHDDPAFWRITMPYWTFNTFAFLEQKVQEKEKYDTYIQMQLSYWRRTEKPKEVLF
ncbi:Phosphotransferase enzyme family [Aspergillus affinis]|uniref:Phosphotransferase enzyme family n=1 Tax=Aspergillus affinis TaxID=1070780 RepID=UPI0022FEB7AB|nr:Phosphotransferase enzyme family [Aspergillus affinis]KAI9037060.1 Phosphotransferase enzyme family [Aspergillus affinis]